MRLIVAKDYADVSRKAANIIAAQIHLKPDCVLGLATGSSPVGTYKELIACNLLFGGYLFYERNGRRYCCRNRFVYSHCFCDTYVRNLLPLESPNSN